MATKYIPDELIAEIVNNGDDVQSYIRKAIEEKLQVDAWKLQALHVV